MKNQFIPIRISYLRVLFLLVFLFNSSQMNAQQNTPATNVLSGQQQGLVVISALTAAGNQEKLKIELNSGLNAGLSINEIKELLVQLYAYCGFPRSLNAINTFKTVLEERKATGISDVVGQEIALENKVVDKYEQGRKMLENLTKTTQTKPAPGFGEFAPRIDAFLKEHLFADIFASDVLSYQKREFVTIAALATMTGVEAQLQAHLNMGANTGITIPQLEKVADLIEKHINRTQANTIRKLIGKDLTPIISRDMIVRISEIEIYAEHVKAYTSILEVEAAKSVELEPGVIAIFPMYQKENKTQFRIIEIYANQAAYQSHLQTAHFKHYKTNTTKMVKSLKLVDMEGIDPQTMLQIFSKLR